MFHQSFPNIDSFMNTPVLEEDQAKVFYNIRLFQLMKFIMINDSAAHSGFAAKSFQDELNNNLGKYDKVLES
jgi:hypothetical protein